ncbi:MULTISPECIES: saccharopine dehydrogenase family protein [Gordonia]|uniref:saccharopine dehydrogenase family protein n=1 Tax=Gordonia TaxID=2053 RepID=UPI0004029A8D|nr:MULTISPECIES: saccharopine dehydrogenase NADP-binding domain-containing protein [Gordonia]KAF0968585.1 putative trans-acting enoyl reductase [Gordonia sp. YY1]MCZ4579304.1 saccharopine dehydrogenase NADP-binding domain-containing protein [Gordonia amicalis]UKO93283.1 saccharopine dehydrogenase NADP-binding domain-containing protein [Gordonia amicalis]UPW13368.1 saccharopine dehydrogenase NADP-binding domain-containing protein [Gordonia amicalis]
MSGESTTETSSNENRPAAGSHGREFDVVVYGATGFVGEITARYLADHAPIGTKVALAGRNESKLAKVRERLPLRAHDWPLIVADSNSPAALDAMVARTQVICTTVGPYLKYGEALVVAAATAGTDYVDLTGEVPFVRYSIDKAHDTAVASGARIVHSCGFDSVPSDLTTYALYKKVAEDGAGEMTDTTLVVKSMRGGLSGGTIDSMRVIADEARNSQARRLMLNPQALSGGPGEVPRVSMSDEPSDLSIISAKKVDPSLRGTLAPFFMAAHNTRIVRRSNALLDNAYGTNFHYAETMNVGGVPAVSTLAAGAVAVGTGVFMGAMSFGPTRRLLDRVLPKPGDGPSEKSRNSGYFVVETFTRTTTGRRYRSQMRAQGDPGYKATAVMLAESALALALDRDRLPSRTGVLTTAAAMGDALIDRLRDAGFTIEATELG